MIVSAIVAMGTNRVIGINGGLPWQLPEDTKFFRQTTEGHIIIMGRKTFESLGKVLPKRLHVVISRRKDYHPEGTHVFANLTEAFAFCETQTRTGQWGNEVFIIGGGEIYREALPRTDRIYLTEIHTDFAGDALFPDFDKSIYRERSRRPGNDLIPYDFVLYQRD